MNPKMKKSFKEFLYETVSKQTAEENMGEDEKYKDVDCSLGDELSKDEKQYCDRKRLLKMLNDFRLRNN
jgi:hypothetical protein